MSALPLSLYIHIPWCVQKCPYCDFNSHQQKGTIPETEYIAHLLDDLTTDIQSFNLNAQQKQREVSSVFIGGGTPSLLSVDAMQHLMDGVRARVPLAKNAEVTMEANPGTVEADKFTGFAQVGVNRISIGVQSYNTSHLQNLGRIHDGQQAVRAISLASDLKLSSFNTDLMHGLAKQTPEQALKDLQTSIDLQVPHISWYQLTIEPNTQFYSKPPTLPDDDVLWEIQELGQTLLAESGYQQYEISAYGKNGHQSQHNLNYWRFGDYLGIGCGAHGKITDLSTGQIQRTVKVKHPKGYMDLSKPYLYEKHRVEEDDLAFEFFMNRFRLLEACPQEDYDHYTFSPLSSKNQHVLSQAADKGLIIDDGKMWQVTALGRRYLNSLLSEFV
ncbi:radical SAM family heme chaperone HemW [Agaribacter flavus]|uniref:Heme chaperone HemW n=1 Tax=Agaribacter flavus TaxID=1902781 RepID=A0ABV7FSK0_9ALTE